MSISTHNPIRRILSPGGLFIAGIFLLILGAGLNYFSGLKGVLKLEEGKQSNLSIGNQVSSDSSGQQKDLGLFITLDSLSIHPYEPEYEIILSRKDINNTKTDYQTGSTFSVVDLFPVEQMKIRKIEKTDLRFRVKEFYPNFEFSYEYPAIRDSIEPIAPGITLELKTKEGTPVVTLHSDQPGKNLLGDIVSLGASLAFYWHMPLDSIKEIAKKNTNGNKIIFSEQDTLVYFILNDSIVSQPLKEKFFYKIPGQDSAGFTILYCFPDIQYLKAVPSTKGSEMLNPVAQIEVWKEGGYSHDAFLYPESRSRRGGDYDIPDADYRLGLRINKEEARKHCDCHLSILTSGEKSSKTITSLAGEPVNCHGFRFSPLECRETSPKSLMMEVANFPGRIPNSLGYVLSGFAIILYLFKRLKPIRHQKA